jgi:hypothetical protein
MELDWDRLDGPFYGNEIATLLIEGRHATLLIEKASARAQDPRLEQVCRRQLA